MSYKKICYVNTLYPLFLFMLMESERDEKEIFFFLGKAIPKEVATRIKNSKYLNKNFENKNKLKKYYDIYSAYRGLEQFIIKENLKDKEIYLQDNMEYSQFFLNHIENCFSLEDGVVNYNEKALNEIINKKEKNRFFKNFRDKFLKKSKIRYKTLGLSEKIQKIYLTGLMEIPEVIKNKVELVNIKEKWEKLPLEKKKKILNIFGFDNNNLKILNEEENKILLITQTFSEDKFISEEEKIKMYEEIINMYPGQKIVIKPHPRERTNYSKIFPNVEIIRSNFPLEVLMVLNIKFKEVVTVYSTAALNFKGITNVNFLGTENYPKIKEKFMEIKNAYYKI